MWKVSWLYEKVHDFLVVPLILNRCSFDGVTYIFNGVLNTVLCGSYCSTRGVVTMHSLNMKLPNKI